MRTHEHLHSNLDSYSYLPQTSSPYEIFVDEKDPPEFPDRNGNFIQYDVLCAAAINKATNSAIIVWKKHDMYDKLPDAWLVTRLSASESNGLKLFERLDISNINTLQRESGPLIHLYSQRTPIDPIERAIEFNVDELYSQQGPIKYIDSNTGKWHYFDQPITATHV